MAWYCERCKRFVDGNEVDVGNVSSGDRYRGITPYHRACLQPVRATKEATPFPAQKKEKA